MTYQQRLILNVICGETLNFAGCIALWPTPPLRQTLQWTCTSSRQRPIFPISSLHGPVTSAISSSNYSQTGHLRVTARHKLRPGARHGEGSVFRACTVYNYSIESRQGPCMKIKLFESDAPQRRCITFWRWFVSQFENTTISTGCTPCCTQLSLFMDL